MTAPQGSYIDNGDTVTFTSAATYSGGDVIQVPDGRAGVVADMAGTTSGDVITAHVKGTFEIDKGTATTFSAGVRCEWDNGTSAAVAADGGDFELGTVLETVGSGPTKVLVAINETPLA